jgi:chemotaxis protein histidine kinase CheA
MNPEDNPEGPNPLRVSFPRATWAVLAIFGLVMLGSLGGQLMLIHNQRDITRQQRQLAKRQLKVTRPLADDVRPLATKLSQADLPRLLKSVTQSVSVLDRRDRLTRLMRSAITVLGSIRRTGLVSKSADAAEVAKRLDRTQQRTLAILKRTLEIQLQALQLNRQTLATARETRDIARDTGAHAANIDRKLGG